MTISMAHAKKVRGIGFNSLVQNLSKLQELQLSKSEANEEVSG